MKQGVDHIGIGVGAVILNDEEKVFLALRGKKARNEVGKWECPGGTVHFGETLKETIIREIKEEFGVDIEVFEQLKAVDHLIPKEKQHWVGIAFVCKIKKGAPKILEPHKCEKIGWFTLREMEKLSLAGPTKHRLLEMKKRMISINANDLDEFKEKSRENNQKKTDDN